MRLYATPHELKMQGQGLDITSDQYDAGLYALCRVVSRLIDKATGRTFWPERKVAYLDVRRGEGEVWLPEPLLAATLVEMSSDNGATYGYTLAEGTDFFTSDGRDAGGGYGGSPIQRLVMAANCPTYSRFYSGQRALRLTGIWGWHERYADAWETSQDTVRNAPLAADATTLEVADADGADLFGLTPRFQVGQLLRLGDEYVEVTGVDTEEDILTLVRGCNGTTAASHTQDTEIAIWRADEVVREAALIQAARLYKRAQQGFQDASASVELGKLLYTRKLDQDVEFMLVEAGLRRLTVG